MCGWVELANRRFQTCFGFLTTLQCTDDDYDDDDYAADDAGCGDDDNNDEGDGDDDDKSANRLFQTCLGFLSQRHNSAFNAKECCASGCGAPVHWKNTNIHKHNLQIQV